MFLLLSIWNKKIYQNFRQILSGYYTTAVSVFLFKLIYNLDCMFLSSLTKWLTVCLRTKWFWVRVQLQWLICNLFWVTKFLTHISIKKKRKEKKGSTATVASLCWLMLNIVILSFLCMSSNLINSFYFKVYPFCEGFNKDQTQYTEFWLIKTYHCGVPQSSI